MIHFLRQQHILWTIVLISALSSVGCASSSLNMANGDIRNIAPDDRYGVVFGTVQMKVEGKPYKSFFSQSLHDTRWVISAKILFEGRSIHTIEAVAAGAEVPFVAKLPKGLYEFFEVEEAGWTAGKAAKGHITSYFRILPQKTVYLGRLLLTVPNRKLPSFNGISVPMPVAVAIEDAQEDTAHLLEDEYGEIIANPTKGLMVKDFNELEKGYYRW